jgi:hypothetical protein
MIELTEDSLFFGVRSIRVGAGSLLATFLSFWSASLSVGKPPKNLIMAAKAGDRSGIGGRISRAVGVEGITWAKQHVLAETSTDLHDADDIVDDAGARHDRAALDFKGPDRLPASVFSPMTPLLLTTAPLAMIVAAAKRKATL